MFRTLPFAALLAAAASTAAAQSFSVSATVSLGAPFEPRGIACADLDGNGHLDLVAPGGATGSVHVALADGAGGYAAPVAYACGTFPFDVAITDLDLDGNPDLIVANRDSNDLSILRGTGGGAFAAATSQATGPGPRTIAVANLDGDLYPDLAVANFGNATVTVLLSDGAGGVRASTDYAVRINPHGIDAADLDGDGRVDLVATSRSNQVLSALITGGAGGFGTRTDFAATRADDVVLADFDGDTVTDAFFANTLGQVGFVAGNGSGGFGAQTLYPTGSGTALRVRAVDLDLDGDLDVVSCNGGDDLSIYRNDGSGNFAAAALVSAGGGATVNNVHACDVDQDGYPDLVCASRFGREIRVLRNQTAAPTGITLYGTGTPTCQGVLGIASPLPQVGDLDYAITTTNSPRSAQGLFLLGGPANVNGFDPIGAGILIHVGPGLIATQLMQSDASGIGRAEIGIPNNALFAGLVFYTQAVFLQNLTEGETCSSSPAGAVTSRALQVVIQP